MGMFKAVRQLQRQSNEINKNWDVGAQLAQAQASMQGATAVMGQQTAAAGIATTGLDGVATITAVRQTGALVNHQPMVELELLVTAAGRPPMPATVTEVVQMIHLPRAQPGAKVAVKVDQQNPSLVWINWAAPAPL